MRGIGRVVRIDDRNERRNISFVVDVRLQDGSKYLSTFLDNPKIVKSALTQSIIAKYG